MKEREILAKKEDEKRQKEIKKQEQAERRRKQAEVQSINYELKFFSVMIFIRIVWADSFLGSGGRAPGGVNVGAEPSKMLFNLGPSDGQIGHPRSRSHPNVVLIINSGSSFVLQHQL